MAKLRLACPAMKIDDAPAITTPTGTEAIPCSASGAAKRLTAQQIASLAPRKTTDQQIAAAALAAIFAADPATAAAAADKIPVQRSGALSALTPALLATYVINAIAEASVAPGAAGALTDSDTLVLAQSGTDKRAALSALKAHVLSGLAAWLAGKAAAGTPADADTRLLCQSGAARKATLSGVKSHVLAALPDWFSSQERETTLSGALDIPVIVTPGEGAASVELVSLSAVRELFLVGETFPGVNVRHEVRSVAAQSGAAALSFTIPGGSRLIAMRLYVDEAVSISHLATDAAEGTTPTADTPAITLTCGTSSLVAAPSAASTAQSLPAAALAAATTPTLSFLASETDGNDYTYSGRVRASLTWEEPAPLAALPESA